MTATGVERIQELRPAPILPTEVAEQIAAPEPTVVPVEVLEAATNEFRQAVAESEAAKAAAALAETIDVEDQEADNMEAIESAMSVAQAAAGGAPRELTLAGLLPARLLAGRPAGVGATTTTGPMGVRFRSEPGMGSGAGAGAGADAGFLNANMQTAMAASLGMAPQGTFGQMGGATMFPPAIPAGPAMIAVDTSPQAMAMDGLFSSSAAGGSMGGNNMLRRARMGGFGGGGIVPGRTEMGEDGVAIKLNPSAAITVQKLG
jgi:hypothetical protein